MPHRVDEGYGLNKEAIEMFAGQGIQLIITVDCGITAVESAKVAKQNNIDLVITDHHHPDDVLPEAAAIVHPALDSGYGNMNSAGAVVAYKLAWALANEFNGAGRLEPHLREFMLNATSLAAMGTVADVMDLRGENRILASYGLKSLSSCKLCGVQALIEVAGLSGAGLDSFDIGFRLAPLLNAAGRMGHARLAVELLTSDNPIRAKKIAEYLKEQNNQRRQCETKIFKEACEMIVASGLNHPDRKSIVLSGENWHIGVVGIVASRVVDKFGRPAIMINVSNGTAQGSARSVAGFNILEAIKSCGDCLESFGGHSMAAGVTLASEHIEYFAERLESYAQDNLKDGHTVAKLDIDSEATIGQLSRNAVEQLESTAPFGQGNPEPMLVTRGVRLAGQPRKVGAKGDHLQIAISDNTGAVRCIGFGMGKLEKKLLESEFFSIAYRPQMNNFNGSSSVQFVLEDVQFE
ncbi:MAG: single-stranded-DNA-specific exonuclease RecJ [Phycisphaerae bacterium]|nr:single-stranded-DNA-specific exonuclease RecJ [Phycisphaerae bacterium]